LSAFRDRGVPKPTSEMSSRAPAQMGRREAEREGGSEVAGARPTLSKRALVLPFIGVRRGSRCTMGGVAECYVSSGGELAVTPGFRGTKTRA
jgi:hypothetical protein